MFLKNLPPDSCRGRAFTLVEVLAGLALLGSLLATSMLVKARNTRQMALSNRRLVAVEATEKLLQSWWTKKTLPLAGSGVLPGQADLTWRTTTRIQPQSAKNPFKMKITRLDIFDQRVLGEDEPIVWLELLSSAEASARWTVQRTSP